MDKKKKITIAVAAVLAVFGLVGMAKVALGSGGFWPSVIDSTARILASAVLEDMPAGGDSLIAAPADQSFGAFSRSRPQRASIALLITTTTPASLLNSDGDDRIVTGAGVFFYSSSGYSAGVAAPSFDMATGTTAYVTSSAVTRLFATTWATSTYPQAYVTGTISGGGLNSLWRTGEYLNLKIGASASTTGMMWVDYISATSTERSS